ncbi:hypothetical protein DRE_01425 [Drechslerella stenobrocha 248]|uniref:Uncharacterized protein n=1 Tax=Drechslerella stenobrocha 248 TaxID=1043628 RepID=W7HUN0_9PEZI|nr:hypothetical protein DRE_01425 [Drechslerella stenobrocha 248]
MTDYESLRLANIQRNKNLLEELQLDKPILQPPTALPSAKRRKLGITPAAPTRSSARLSALPRPSYKDEPDANQISKPPTKPLATSQPSRSKSPSGIAPSISPTNWSSWTPAAPPPTRSEDGTLNFASHPSFLPNKTPHEVIREGCFGGTYFRPLYSAHLGLTISNDHMELPASWTQGLDASRYILSPTYDASVNKYGVACGQSIEQWEANGWINHDFDVRGWFQWYCRFYQGRRCADDERQVGRWQRCCGARGRWRRALLKRYRDAGVREVFADDEEDGSKEVSPVVHQTCHHWAWELRQPVLDAYWAD